MIDKAILIKYANDFGVSLDDAAADKFDRYAELLVEANTHINLTAICEPQDIVVKHFADSLSVLSAVELPQGASVIDVGTGAGFPGAALLIARPDLQVTMLDGTLKKLNFVDSSVKAIGLSASIVHARAEEAGQKTEYREKFDLVTARAVAALRELCEYCLPFAKVGGAFVAMKSGQVSQEISDAESAIKLLGGKIDNTVSFTLPDGSERSLVVIKKISQTPPKYPRPSAKIAKQPLK